MQTALHGRKAIYWIDNDSARASKSAAMFSLALVLSEVDNASPTLAWTERVPSYSNVADWPSRQEGEKALSLVNASVVEPFALDASLIARLLGQNV